MAFDSGGHAAGAVSHAGEVDPDEAVTAGAGGVEAAGDGVGEVAAVADVGSVVPLAVVDHGRHRHAAAVECLPVLVDFPIFIDECDSRPICFECKLHRSLSVEPLYGRKGKILIAGQKVQLDYERAL